MIWLPLLTPLVGYRPQISTRSTVLLLPINKRIPPIIKLYSKILSSVPPTANTTSIIPESIIAVFETVFALLFPFFYNSNKKRKSVYEVKHSKQSYSGFQQIPECVPIHIPFVIELREVGQGDELNMNNTPFMLLNACNARRY